ncbi:hypothetical protein BS47DRAFT_1401950 [Hydnum rufescens UP504]|uniref:Uncharacterized protein n=1 Tax=Hydnum rufescens UP504 TaxID=1448309 RepID=A0A9P6DMU2_9AGAM|nr:hypothetical protein BS47DRAFT_1401950 [Hydnum rufescens UP504]
MSALHDLSTEKASDTARIAMSGGDVAHQMALSRSKIDSEALRQIGVHLVYLMGATSPPQQQHMARTRLTSTARN